MSECRIFFIIDLIRTASFSYRETTTLAVAVLDGSLSDDARKVTVADAAPPSF